MSDDQPAPVLLYDGVCGFCNRSVRAIIRFDRRGTLKFAALDSDFARAVMTRHPELADVDSMVYVENPGRPDERAIVRSAASLAVYRYLGGAFRLLLLFGLIPARVRDWGYDRFAAVRYRVAGRYDSCPIPPPSVRARFVDA